MNRKKKYIKSFHPNNIKMDESHAKIFLFNILDI